MEELTLKHLLASDHPEMMITDEIWQSWTNTLSSSSVSSEKVFDIANDLGLDWIYTRRNESLSLYLQESLAGILSRRGFGKKKARTVILCIAASALNNELMPRMPKANKIESVFVNRNRAETNGLLQKTLLDVLNIPDDTKQSLWAYFEARKLSSLAFPEKEWSRLENFGLYPDDGLENILVLSLEYIYFIWRSEEDFTYIIGQIAALAGRALGAEIKWDVEHICTSSMLFEDSKISPLGSLYITKSFVPDESIQFLHAIGVLKWSDLKLSMSDLARLYGFSFKLIEFLMRLQMLQPDIERVVSCMAPILKYRQANSSFESLMRYLIQRRIGSKRDVEIIMERMALGSERPKTLDNLGRKMGLTRERVRQIEKKLLRRLQHQSLVKDLLPLWVVVLSSIEAHGVLRVSKIARLLQSHFGWPKAPSIDGLINLMSIVWGNTLEKNGIHFEQGFFILSSFQCIMCSKIDKHITGLMSSSTEMPIKEAVPKIGSFCLTECNDGRNQRWVISSSFVEFMVINKQALSDSIMISKNKLLSKEYWNLQNGSILDAVETILKRSGRAMHFSEIHESILKIRGDIRTPNLHTVHAAMGRSENTLLWDRGVYIHKQNAPFPFSIIRNVETWLKDKLEGVPFITVFGAFQLFKQQCIDASVPSESALYSCLRVSGDQSLEYPKYPYIYLASSYAGRLSLASVIEDFVKRYDGVVPFDVLRDYAVNSLNIKEFMFGQLLEKTTNILHTQTGYLHVDLMDIDKEKLAEIIDHTKGMLSKVRHVSVAKVFSSKEVTCRSIGINEPVLLYSILQFYAGDKFHVTNYPQIHTLTENDERGIKGITASVTEYIRQKRAPVTYQELYDYFFEKLGYSKNTIYFVVNSDGVFKFLPGCVVHHETIGWSADISATVESLAEQVYSDEEKAGRYFASIETIVENDENLPLLSNGVYWTEFLLADILHRSNRFRLVGSTRTAYVLIPNVFGIETFEDLCYVTLKRDFQGAANLEAFTHEMIDLGIVARSVTPSMLGSSKKVTIVGKEILLTELIQ